MPNGFMSTPPSETALRIAYAYYSWEYEFTDEIEAALEQDYIKNTHLYDTETPLKVIRLFY